MPSMIAFLWHALQTELPPTRAINKGGICRKGASGELHGTHQVFDV